MGFSKKTSAPEITVVITHRMHPGDEYEFDFPKQMPQAAVDAETRFLGLPDEARPDELRRALIETVAAQVLREPRGFEDFPKIEAGVDWRADFVGYFDDPAHPELEQIISAAWRARRALVIPDAYTKSLQDSGAGSSNASGTTAQAQSGA